MNKILSKENEYIYANPKEALDSREGYANVAGIALSLIDTTFKKYSFTKTEEERKKVLVYYKFIILPEINRQDSQVRKIVLSTLSLLLKFAPDEKNEDDINNLVYFMQKAVDSIRDTEKLEKNKEDNSTSFKKIR